MITTSTTHHEVDAEIRADGTSIWQDTHGKSGHVYELAFTFIVDSDDETMNSILMNAYLRKPGFFYTDRGFEAGVQALFDQTFPEFAGKIKVTWSEAGMQGDDFGNFDVFAFKDDPDRKGTEKSFTTALGVKVGEKAGQVKGE